MDSKEVEFTSMEVFEICPWCWKLVGQDNGAIPWMSGNARLFIPKWDRYLIEDVMDRSLRRHYFVFNEFIFVDKDHVISLGCHQYLIRPKSCNPTKWSDIIPQDELSTEQKEFIDQYCFEEPNQHCVQERDDSNEPTGQIVMLPEPVVAHSFGMSVYVKQINGIWSVRIFDHETGDHYVIPQIFLTIPSMYRGFVFSYQEMDFSFNHYYNSIFKFPLIQRSDKFFNRKFQANYQQSKVWKEDETTTEVPTSTPESDICVPRWQLEDKTCRPYPRKLQKETPKSLLSDDTFVGTVGGCIIFVEIVIGVAAILYVWRKCPPKPKPLRPKDISITYLSDNEGV
ncbi:hypothetical protein M3Y95_00336900 [Aphelenchoides besseyi]|nr:hypothetical protein M3Y95_00336900 [Aphelenchoides besseyi]